MKWVLILPLSYTLIKNVIKHCQTHYGEWWDKNSENRKDEEKIESNENKENNISELNKKNSVFEKFTEKIKTFLENAE